MIQKYFNQTYRKSNRIKTELTSIFLTGASSGIGRAIALRLANKGFSVFAAGRSVKRLRSLKEEAENNGYTITPVRLDLDDPDSLTMIREEFGDQKVRVDVLINNAAFGVWGPLETLSDEKLRAQFETNLFGLMSLTRLLLPSIKLSSHGKIINVSSVLGRFGTPFNGAYVASKFALEGLSESLRIELSPFNVGVTVVEPGLFDTNFSKNQVDGTFLSESLSPYHDYIKGYRGRRNTYSRPGNPEEVAKTIEKIIDSKRPKFRYVVGKDAKIALALKNIIPDKIFAYFLLF